MVQTAGQVLDGNTVFFLESSRGDKMGDSTLKYCVSAGDHKWVTNSPVPFDDLSPPHSS